MTGKRLIVLAGPMLAAALSCGAAQAQSLEGALSQGAQPSGDFARNRNVSVTERQHPEYQPIGIRSGGLMFLPKLAITQDYSDNIFATPRDTTADGITHVAPEVDMFSFWSRNAISAFVRGGFNQYWQNSSQNTKDFAAGAQGRLDVQRGSAIQASVSYARVTEPRTSPASEGSAFPIQYNALSTDLTAFKEFNRLRISGRLDWQRFRFLDRAGNFPQDDQDHDFKMATLRADYALSPGAALFVEAAGNDRSYRLKSSPIIGGLPQFPAFVNRDSSGVQVLAGANFELGALMRGEVGVGYLNQTYKDARFSHVSGPGARAQVEWFPSQLITVTVTGSRTVEDAAIPGATAFTAEQGSVKVDYELLRNLILTARAGYGKDDYRGVSRRDERVTATVGGNYLLNRHVSLGLDYSYYDQDSRGTSASVAGANFTVNKIAATLKLQY